jgi:hypothetical protein
MTWASPRRRAGFAIAAIAVAAVACAFACSDPSGNDTNVPDQAEGGGASVACSQVLPTCPSTPPSYKTDIGPLIVRDCEPCHAPGGVSQDRDLTSYDNVYKLRTTVLTQIYGCLMPPLDAGIADAPSGPLDAGDRQLLLQWLECHAPEN